MHLKRVILNNFRCFETLEIELHPHLTVLVADNGGGKTSILDGIALGLSPVLQHLSQANLRLSGVQFSEQDVHLRSESSLADASSDSVPDHCQVIVETTTGLRWDNYRASATGLPIPGTIGQEALADHASAILGSLDKEARHLLPVFAYYGAKRGWIEVPERIRAARLDDEPPTSGLVGALRAHTDFKEMLKWFDAEEAFEASENREADSTTPYESVVLKEVRSAIVSLLGGDYKKPRFNKRHKFVVTSESSQQDFQVSQLSQGYQSMLALGMDFARRLAIANEHLLDIQDTSAFEERYRNWVAYWRESKVTPPRRSPRWAPAIMLVDEIDLHLHPAWQQRVLADLICTFPGTQFIVTTHSPHVLSTVNAESIRILRTAGRRATVETPKFQTRGVESAGVLARIMEVDPVPRVIQARWLSDYTAMVQAGQADSPAAQSLWGQLVSHFGVDHPVLADVAVLRRLQEFKRSQIITGGGGGDHAPA